jgi:predicted P-loop ATPase
MSSVPEIIVIPEVKKGKRRTTGLEALAGEGWHTTDKFLNAIKLRD